MQPGGEGPPSGRAGSGAEASGAGGRGGEGRARVLTAGAAVLLGLPPRVRAASLALLWRGKQAALPAGNSSWEAAAPCPHPEAARAAVGALLLGAKVEEAPLRVGDAVNAVLWLDAASCGALGPEGAISAAARGMLREPLSEAEAEDVAAALTAAPGGLFTGTGGPWVGERYERLRPGALAAEWELLTRCRCTVASDSPMKYLLNFCARRGCPGDIAGLAVAFLNDGLLHAGLLEAFEPHEAAAGALFLALGGGEADGWGDLGTNREVVRRAGMAILDALEPFSQN